MEGQGVGLVLSYINPEEKVLEPHWTSHHFLPTTILLLTLPYSSSIITMSTPQDSTLVDTTLGVTISRKVFPRPVLTPARLMYPTGQEVSVGLVFLSPGADSCLRS